MRHPKQIIGRISGAAALPLLALVLSVGISFGAQEANAADQSVGPETNLPMPRFVSLKKEKANIRRGPGLTYRIDWVFLRRGMPLEITAEHGHWRKVRDVDDAGGWVHHALLRGARTAIVTAEQTALRDAPGLEGAMVAVAQAGVVLNLRSCGAKWCEVDVTDDAGRHEGWADKSVLWGVRRDEEFD